MKKRPYAAFLFIFFGLLGWAGTSCDRPDPRKEELPDGAGDLIERDANDLPYDSPQEMDPQERSGKLAPSEPDPSASKPSS